MIKSILTAKGISASRRMAARLEGEFESLWATQRLRRIFIETCSKYFRPGNSLLELGCGIDAIELASQHMRVLVADQSEEPLKKIARRLAAMRAQLPVQTRHLTLRRLHELAGNHFDGAYSHFGVLNSTRHLGEVVKELAMIVKPQGLVVLCFLSKYSLWEVFRFVVRAKPKRAFRRLGKNGALVDQDGEKVWLHFHSPKAIVHLFSSHFIPVEMYGLNILTPPPSFSSSARVLARLLQPLGKLDDLLARWYPFYMIGDLFVVVFRRK